MRWQHDTTSDLLTEGHVLHGLWRLAMPMLVSGVLQNLQSLIDLFWVGSLGACAIAAVAMSGTVLMVLFPVLIGISIGTIALVARMAGAKRWQEANEAVGQSLMLAFVLGSICGLAGWYFSGRLFSLLGADPDVTVLGYSYIRILLLWSFAVFVLFTGNSALQGAGDTLTPMIIMGSANVLNIVLDPVFIFGFGPFSGMGVRGAAVATVIAQAIAVSALLFILFKGKSRIHVRLAGWKLDLNLCWRVLRIGIPGSAQMLSRSLIGALMMRIVAGSGIAAVAAYGTCLRFHFIMLMPIFALGGAAATMVGQNLGAGKPERARNVAWLAAGITMVFMALAAAVIVTFSQVLIRLFNSDPDVVQIGSCYLRVVLPFFVFAALGIVMCRALNGAGETLAPMILTVITLWGLQVPLAILFSRLWQPATLGIWWAIAIAMAVNGLLMAAWFEKGKWKTQLV